MGSSGVGGNAVMLLAKKGTNVAYKRLNMLTPTNKIRGKPGNTVAELPIFLKMFPCLSAHSKKKNQNQFFPLILIQTLEKV